MRFYPEGVNHALVKHFYTTEQLKEAIDSRAVFEGRVVACDSHHHLHIDLGGYTGLMPRTEGALGILEGTVRDIALISRVNRRVCFRVMGLHRGEHGETVPILSRRSVQLRCKRELCDTLCSGDVLSVNVTRLEDFGVFIDVGAGLSALIPIDMLSVSRIRHPSQRLACPQEIRAVFKKREGDRMTFSLKELLGTWEENAAAFHAGDTVPGVVRSVESYGVFVELAPNLAGLAEPYDGLFEGQLVSVYIKSVVKEKMKIKLAVAEAFDAAPAPMPLRYFVKDNHLDSWQYSPRGAAKNIMTLF